MIFGYAINFNVKHIKIAVFDMEKSIISRDFISLLQNSEYFDLVKYIDNYNEVDTYLDEKIAQCVVVIPNDFSKKINSGQAFQIQYLIDFMFPKIFHTSNFRKHIDISFYILLD